jgi:protein-S-isoprenylcysteine O-methyltransferase Ste14
MKIRKTPRIIIGFVVALLFIWRARPTSPSFALGALIMVLGECVRFVSAGTLIKFEGVTRSGIYSFTRNPLYIGSFIIGLGACVMGRDLVFTGLFLLLFPIVYSRVIKREEAYLVGRYGEEYEAYLREVPRILPRRFDLAGALRETSPFLAVKNRELPAILGLMAVLGVMAVKMAV